METANRFPALELRHLRHALALVEHGNFARAAEACHITQPALTKSIRALEDAVGATLFNRTRTGVEPTEFGQILLQHAREIDDAARDLERNLRSARGSTINELVISTGPYHGSALVAPVIADFVQRHPDVRVQVYVTPFSSHTFRERARRFDLVIGENGRIEEEGLFDSFTMADHPGALVARPEHPLAGRREVSIAEARQYRIAGPWLGVTEIERVASRATNKTRVAMRDGGFAHILCESADLVKSVVASTDAIGLVHPFLVAREVEAGLLRLLPVRDLGLAARYGVGWIAGRQLNPLAAEFVVMLRNHDARLAKLDRAMLRGS